VKNLVLETQTMEYAPYRKALVEAGERNDRVLVLGADLANSTEIDGFRDRFPDRFFNIGVAEQNALNIAAGLSFEGEIPFVHSFGVFITRRAYEQVCVQVAMHRANVKMVGLIPGLTSRLGPTHQAIDDLSLMRVLPNLTVIDPADATEIEQAVAFAVEYDGPVYLRMMRREVPRIFDPSVYRFTPGRGVCLSEGGDVAVISTGLMLAESLSAVKMLAEHGIAATLLHMPTVKPFDDEALCRAASLTGALVTVENHLVSGGLGSITAEVLAAEHPAPLERVGLRDIFAEPGTPEYLFEKYGMTAPFIVKAAQKVMERKGKSS